MYIILKKDEFLTIIMNKIIICVYMFIDTEMFLNFRIKEGWCVKGGGGTLSVGNIVRVFLKPKKYAPFLGHEHLTKSFRSPSL